MKFIPGPCWHCAQPQYEQNVLVHFCPLNVNSNHFTLLEINERERVIYHYDSMASQGVINGRIKQTRVGEIVEVRIGSCDCDINVTDVISGGVRAF
jgi:Ulp1 protease family, C-terminal catalytic domain